jgi:hypothetical protein
MSIRMRQPLDEHAHTLHELAYAFAYCIRVGCLHTLLFSSLYAVERSTACVEGLREKLYLDRPLIHVLMQAFIHAELYNRRLNTSLKRALLDVSPLFSLVSAMTCFSSDSCLLFT